MNDPYALPGGADLSGFPRTLMIDADRDSLRASGEAFHAELTEAGANVEYAIVEGSKHGFLDRPTTLAFQQGISRVSQWLGA
jgi:acetyl esterase/lipase